MKWPFKMQWLFGIFILVLTAHMILWTSPLPITDSELWTASASTIAAGILPDFSTPTPSHPGTTILLPTALLIALHVPATRALGIVMAILMSLCIILIVQQCAIARPHTLWWVSALIVLVPNHLYLQMTPPSAFAAVLAALYVVLLLRIRDTSVNHRLVIALGACGGFLLATRIDIGAALIFISFPYLWSIVRTRALMCLAVAFVVFTALNPYMWIHPILQIQEFVDQIGSNVLVTLGFGFSFSILISTLLAFFLCCVLLCAKKAYISIPRDFLWWLLIFSVVMSLTILRSHYHPARYFFPLMTIWELFLPLFLFESLDRIPRFSDDARRTMQYIVVILLLLMRIAPALAFLL